MVCVTEMGVAHMHVLAVVIKVDDAGFGEGVNCLGRLVIKINPTNIVRAIIPVIISKSDRLLDFRGPIIL